MIFKVFSLKVKKMHDGTSAALLGEDKRGDLPSSATRVTYMQFVLTKGASLSHCVPRERDRRRDRQRDLNSLFWDSRRDNSDGDESGLQRGRKRSGGERERGQEGGDTDNSVALSALRPSVPKNTAEFRRFTFPRVNTLRIEKKTRYEWRFKKMQIGLPITRRPWRVIVNNNCDPIILTPADLLPLSLPPSPSHSRCETIRR